MVTQNGPASGEVLPPGWGSRRIRVRSRYTAIAFTCYLRGRIDTQPQPASAQIDLPNSPGPYYADGGSPAPRSLHGRDVPQTRRAGRVRRGRSGGTARRANRRDDTNRTGPLDGSVSIEQPTHASQHIACRGEYAELAGAQRALGAGARYRGAATSRRIRWRVAACGTRCDPRD